MAAWAQKQIGGILTIVVLIDLAVCVDINFDDTKDGFFLKSTYHKFKPSEPAIVKESLILTHPAEVYKLRASYGPFEKYQSVPNDVLSSVVQYGEDVMDKSESSMHRQVVHNMDVSAHLIGGGRFIGHSNPKIQLLVHAQPLVRRQKQHLIYTYYGYSQRWCARLFVTQGKEQYTSACVLNDDTNACVVGMDLPEHWWNNHEKFLNFSSPFSSSSSSQEVLVFYDLTGVEQNQDCASVSNTIVPTHGIQDNTEKKFITAVKLLWDDHITSYTEHKSQNLSFHVPEGDLAPGVKFDVPVVLEPHSSLKTFYVQVQVHGNIAIDGASTDMNSPWIVFFEAGDSESTATVTAMLKENREIYQSESRSVEVMQWQFRVPFGSDTPQTARVTWIVNYERHDFARDAFLFPEGFKLSVKFNVLPDHAEQIIPVLKERSLLNTAILSGKQVISDLVIFSVAQDNTFRDVTKRSNCRSLYPQVVKVSLACDQVFLDGSETHGSKNVTIIVRSGKEEAQLSIRVWVPEPNLDIQLSDPKLSQVRRWKVPRKDLLKSRFVRSADPADLNKLFDWQNRTSRGSNKATSSKTCGLKYQQSQVEVYARFVISSPGQGTEFFRSKKTFVRVTGLVLPHMRTSNPTIAKMHGQTVQGISPGVTSVQVISPTGKVLGSEAIRVAKDKVDIERLMVRVISGMTMRIDKIDNVPGALLATVSLQDQLAAKQQEAVLDIVLEFKDGTMLPLSNIDPEEYDLRVTSVNNKIVEVTEMIIAAPYVPPSIKAIGDGKGEFIKVTLKERSSCERKKPRTLDTEYVHVQVDFAKDVFSNLIQSDGSYPGTYDGKNQDSFNNKEEYFKQLKEQHILDKSEPKVRPINKHDTYTVDDVDSDVTKEPLSEALEQAVSTKAKHPSPLEVAMYVLVAVFVFAILVFTANCAVFMMRHQRKCKPHSKGLSSKVVAGSISQAPDWVWIGRATLERQGAGNAGVDHALMAEEDFNGNQMVLPNSATGSAASRHSSTRKLAPTKVSLSRSRSSSSSGSCPATSASSGCASNRNSMVSTYQGSECSIRITSNPLPEELVNNDLGGMGYNEAEWDYEAMGMTYEQLMDYFDNLKESSA
ncbi:transmembrane protein 132c [Plakobranchus ocellatus]|uniref:Transmembrane protein 132c n=1 Tax=Plakobranchus ocellatus TaxID=259542 RepID=A0AAV4DIW0_9GAST|nr:transmembrane protein 132c [Plakobranchus ocellatus]